MRKLKLQVQASIDGFVGGPNGELDFMEWNWDDELKNFVDSLHRPVDCILLGKNMTDGFVSHWEKLAETTTPEDEENWFAHKMTDTKKIVFSNTLKESKWKNTELAKGDYAKFINELKQQPGSDIIVYGGATFVSSLIKANLIDEYYLFVNPSAIGKGLTIFGSLDKQFSLNQVNSKGFACGITLLQYEPKSD